MTDTETMKSQDTADTQYNDVDKRPPGPDGLLLLGNTVGFLREGIGFTQRLQEHGDVVRYTAFGEEFVVVSDPELIESVLISRNEEF